MSLYQVTGPVHDNFPRKCNSHLESMVSNFRTKLWDGLQNAQKHHKGQCAIRKTPPFTQ